MEKVKVVQFGIGGWGWHFFDNASANWPDENYVYEGVVDPNARKSPIYEKIKSMGIPIYESPEEFYKNHDAHLAVITASIPAHCPMTVFALEHGQRSDTVRMIPFSSIFKTVWHSGYSGSTPPAVPFGIGAGARSARCRCNVQG